MPDIKEKLVELLVDFNLDTNNHICDGCGTRPVSESCVEIADYLIANGVTIQKWISVEERLPECKLYRDIFNRPSRYYSDTVLVCLKSVECDGTHHYVATDMLTGITLDSVHWLKSCGYGGDAVYSQEITHWMPFPELPKEDK